MNKDRNNTRRKGGNQRSFGGREKKSDYWADKNSNFRRNNFSSENREMHKAVCSKCGKDCEVPFKPIEGKSVFCKECYVKKKRF